LDTTQPSIKIAYFNGCHDKYIGYAAFFVENGDRVCAHLVQIRMLVQDLLEALLGIPEAEARTVVNFWFLALLIQDT
jgi:hypothetical protein